MDKSAAGAPDLTYIGFWEISKYLRGEGGWGGGSGPYSAWQCRFQNPDGLVDLCHDQGWEGCGYHLGTIFWCGFESQDIFFVFSSYFHGMGLFWLNLLSQDGSKCMQHANMTYLTVSLLMKWELSAPASREINCSSVMRSVYVGNVDYEVKPQQSGPFITWNLPFIAWNVPFITWNLFQLKPHSSFPSA